MTVQQFLDWIKGLIEESAPALAVMFWDYEQSKEDEIKHEASDAQLQLQLEKNHEEIESINSGKSDNDIINEAIASGDSGDTPKK
jgi:hypothetical protein